MPRGAVRVEERQPAPYRQAIEDAASPLVAILQQRQTLPNRLTSTEER